MDVDWYGSSQPGHVLEVQGTDVIIWWAGDRSISLIPAKHVSRDVGCERQPINEADLPPRESTRAVEQPVSKFRLDGVFKDDEDLERMCREFKATLQEIRKHRGGNFPVEVSAGPFEARVK